MRVLRSRIIVSTETTPKSKTQKTRQQNHNLEPSTPAQNKEPSALSSSRSPNSHPPSDSPAVSMGPESDSVLSSGLMRRHTRRLSSKVVEPDEASGRNRSGGGSKEDEEEAVDHGVLGMDVNNEGGFTLIDENFRVVEDGGEDRGGGEGFGEVGLGSDTGNSGKRKLGIDINSLPLGCEEDGEGSKGVLNLRSGKKVGKRRVEGVDEESEVQDMGDFGKETPEGGEKRKSKLADHGDLSNCLDLIVLDSEEETESLDVNVVEGGSVGGNRKGKRKMSFGSEDENVEEAPTAISNDTHNRRRRFCINKKGKGKWIEYTVDNEVLYGPRKVEKFESILMLANAVALVQEEDRIRSYREDRANMYRERFREIAKENATRFAYFNREEEEEMPAKDFNESDTEDWPGPFSTAMKIIRDRERTSLRRSSSVGSKRAQLIWTPKNSKGKEHECFRPRVPTLTELSTMCLADNADSITSLEFIPDVLKHRLSKLLSDSRRMDGQFFRLLVQGSPTEVRLWDCSWLTEEVFTDSLENFDPSNLAVLQLDQCGRCLPDYILVDTLAKSANYLPALVTLSIRGACRLTDVGLKFLISSTPALRSLNISQCSLLTSSSIDTIAISLGSVLRELYLDDCQGIDAMLMLPAVKNLEQLEVLSLAGMESVCDTFIMEFIRSRGDNIKELILTNCGKLTDSSVKIISETCSGLLAIDLGNVCKLTSSSLVYLANGCQNIRRLRLCRNSFSDKSIAAFLESSGLCLEELSLNNIRKVGCQTALSIGRLRKLNSLDLSWCRNLSDNELGFIVDSCLSLRVLKLFGCTQITNIFLDGHSNPDVQIIGLKMSPVLDNVCWAHPYDAPLRYTSAPSSYL
ncbi:hypothetical protein F8388_002145 [Cannabis sativa]|uniref:Uncharacterized protein n=1 Tax=Cannabis sativa TaxID=3483 RepID=A0A7J6H3S3_CANSA|nr:hypothetical protein F8388_002145 [Cannabis sativa]KAF4389874.1 hypothetical protein G4B88_024155 [Cannabis sativa]